MSKAFKIIAEQYDCPVSYRISNYKNFIPKYLDNAFTDFAFTNIEAAIGGKSPVNDCERTVPSTKK